MNSYTLILPELDATIALAQRLAPALRGGDCVALLGDMGAGKTTFVVALMQVFGQTATSPTFALVNQYVTPAFLVCHVDLYRLDAAHEAYALGLDDLVGAPHVVSLVEWADKFDVLPADVLTLGFRHAGAGRVVEVTAHGMRSEALAAHLADHE